MTNQDIKFRGHEYSGRENGLMIIGSDLAIQELVTQLNGNVKTKDTNWPHLLTSINLGTESNPYTLSFHLENDPDIPPTNIPRSTKSFSALLILVPFATLGVWSVVKWVMHAF